METLLADIIKSVSDTRGADFFAGLTLQLDKAIASDLTFIARIDKKQAKATTVAFVEQGKLVDNTSYSLIHTPCEQVAANTLCVYPQDVCQQFPRDDFLTRMKAVGYLGMPLTLADGRVVAIVVAIYLKPITEQEKTLSLFKIFSGRICAEFEGLAREAELLELNKSLVELNDSLDDKIRLRSFELESALGKLQKAHAHRLEMNKLSALGDLISGIAHEINGPIGVAITAESHLAEVFKEFTNKVNGKGLTIKAMKYFIEQQSASLPMIANNLERAKQILENFKKTATEQVNIEPETISLNEYYQRVISTLIPLLKRKQANITFSGCQDDMLTTLPGCHAQVLMNLVRNSIEHGFVDSREHNITIAIEKKAGVYIVDYFDNGVGMTQGKQAEILQPVENFPGEVADMGLGLLICRRLIVEELGGECAFIPCQQGVHFQYQFRLMS
ncbi:sensor histidine kinase [Thalassomonas haliotis]|uniref:HAMP domain-containing histidine kinase n=1 Tax=Thalassomonas haliotis TaxID=485448 RepID=A0ABY7VMI4_9GAMM|nr:HAMP domain-containing sensor histidine kinase [Thalassomonas haliotis]WDE13842.1 HAMP domain-containing histidine kinase [Thalassomonas haliotis]